MARATATRTNRELVGCFMADDMCFSSGIYYDYDAVLESVRGMRSVNFCASIKTQCQ